MVVHTSCRQGAQVSSVPMATLALAQSLDQADFRLSHYFHQEVTQMDQ